MNAKEFAAILNGRAYRKEMTKGEEAWAKEFGLVVAFGSSDDLVELRGAISEEVNAYEGTEIYFTPDGLLEDCECSCPYFEKAKEKAVVLEAFWREGDWTWTFSAPFPCETFEIFDDEEKFCRGIVFALADVNPK